MLIDVHRPPDTVEENVVVFPTHADCVPESVPAVGSEFTVIVLVAVAFEQPPVPLTE